MEGINYCMVIFYHTGARLRGVENVKGNDNFCMYLGHIMAYAVFRYMTYAIILLMRYFMVCIMCDKINRPSVEAQIQAECEHNQRNVCKSKAKSSNKS